MKKDLYLKSFAQQVGLDNVLTYRPKAEKMYNIAIQSIAPVSAGDVLVCSFDGIDACDISFADQFIVNLQLYVLTQKDVLTFFVAANNDIRENIEAALLWRCKKEKRRVCILAFDNTMYHIVGDLEKNLVDTFELLSRKAEIAARDVAEAFDIEINSASNRLKKLYDLHLLCRKEQIDESGRQHIYFLP